MRVLLTGGTGFIGKELGKKLVAQNHEVVALVRNPARARTELPYPAQLVEWKGYQYEVPSNALNDVEAVIHLAGEPVAGRRWTSRRKKEIFDSRALGTRRLVEAASKSSIKDFISASAIGIYGDRGDEDLFEDSKEGTGFLADVCRAWEAATEPLIARSVRVVNVRIGMVLSKQGGALAKLLPLFSRGLGGALGNGSQWTSWIHLDDVTGLLLFALTHNKIMGPLNAVAPKPVTNLEFSQKLAHSLGKGLFLPVPKFALKIALGEMSEVVLSGQKVSAKKAMLSGYGYHYSDLGSALREICGPVS